MLFSVDTHKAMIFYHILESRLQNMFNKLRDNYRRCIRKREQVTRSGSGRKKLPTCDFFGELSFLHDIVSGRSTDTNLFTPPRSPMTSPAQVEVENFEAARPTLPAAYNSAPINQNVSVSSKKPKRKVDIDELLAESLAADLKKSKHNEEQKNIENSDSDFLFCRSLVEQFKGLTKKQNKEARIKIMQVFLDYEED